jgi:DNA processing protein
MSANDAHGEILQGRLLIAPVPKEAHADEPKSRGIVALTQKTGPT